jgi:hypothetical protein
MVARTGRIAALIAGSALLVPGGAAARESRPVTVLADTASNGVSYRVALTRVTARVGRGRDAVTRDFCLRVTFRGARKKLLRSRRRCLGRGFEYRSPSLLVTNERDPDSAPLVFGFAVPGVARVELPVAGGGASVDAGLRPLPSRFGSHLRVFAVRGLDAAPLGARAFDRDGVALDGVLFPPP